MAAPVITAVSPPIGYIPGGRQVTITGTGMDTVTAVLFGATASTIVSQTATQVVVTLPAASAAGAVSVTATNPDGSDVEASAFTYLDDWLGGSLAAVETMLCNCATFRTLMGVATVPLAREKCYWQFRRGTPTAPYAQFTLDDGGSMQGRGSREFTHSDTVAVRIVWTELSSASDSEKTISERNVNALGKIFGECRDLMDSSTYLRGAVITYEPPEPVPDDDNERGAWDAVLTFSWSI